MSVTLVLFQSVLPFQTWKKQLLVLKVLKHSWAAAELLQFKISPLYTTQCFCTIFRSRAHTRELHLRSISRRYASTAFHRASISSHILDIGLVKGPLGGISASRVPHAAKWQSYVYTCVCFGWRVLRAPTFLMVLNTFVDSAFSPADITCNSVGIFSAR